MNVKFVYYDRSYKNLRPEIDLEMQRVLSAGDLILRGDVERFEENLSQFVGTKYAVALSSGTDALYLALKFLGIGKGDEVITSSHTFKSTVGSVINVGAKPIIVDIGVDGLIDVDKIEKEITKRTKAIIPVHIAGAVCGMYRLEAIRQRSNQGISIIEDACQAIGADYQWGFQGSREDNDAYILKTGNIAEIGCFSFYPAKILGSFGDAGALTTNDENIAEYAREARNHFKTDNREFGGNHRMDNLQAAILNVKFKYLPKYLERRKEAAERYLKELKGLYYRPHSQGIIDLKLPNNQQGRVWQDFIVDAGIMREGLYDFLKKEGVETMKNEYPWTPEYPKLPLAAKYEAETLRLPCNSEIEDEEVEYVIQKVKEFYA